MHHLWHGKFQARNNRPKEKLKRICETRSLDPYVFVMFDIKSTFSSNPEHSLKKNEKDKPKHFFMLHEPFFHNYVLLRVPIS